MQSFIFLRLTLDTSGIHLPCCTFYILIYPMIIQTFHLAYNFHLTFYLLILRFSTLCHPNISFHFPNFSLDIVSIKPFIFFGLPSVISNLPFTFSFSYSCIPLSMPSSIQLSNLCIPLPSVLSILSLIFTFHVILQFLFFLLSYRGYQSYQSFYCF